MSEETLEPQEGSAEEAENESTASEEVEE